MTAISLLFPRDSLDLEKSFCDVNHSKEKSSFLLDTIHLLGKIVFFTKQKKMILKTYPIVKQLSQGAYCTAYLVKGEFNKLCVLMHPQFKTSSYIKSYQSIEHSHSIRALLGGCIGIQVPSLEAIGVEKFEVNGNRGFFSDCVHRNYLEFFYSKGSLLESISSFSSYERIHLAEQLLLGAFFTMFNGISHGDIKLENIFVHQDMIGKTQVVLGDWGGAKTFDYPVEGAVFSDFLFPFLEHHRNSTKRTTGLFVSTPFSYEVEEMLTTKKLVSLASKVDIERRRDFIDLIAGREFLRDHLSLSEVLFEILCPDSLTLQLKTNHFIKDIFLEIFGLRKNKAVLVQQKKLLEEVKRDFNEILSCEGSFDSTSFSSFFSKVRHLHLNQDEFQEVINFQCNFEGSVDKIDALVQRCFLWMTSLEIRHDEQEKVISRKFTNYENFMKKSLDILKREYPDHERIIEGVFGMRDRDIFKRGSLYDLCLDVFGEAQLQSFLFRDFPLVKHLSLDLQCSYWNERKELVLQRLHLAQQKQILEEFLVM